MSEPNEISPGNLLRVMTRKPYPKSTDDPRKRARFFKTLASTANVTEACSKAGFSPTTVYRRRALDAEFRGLWRKALAEGYAKLELKMLERAFIGERTVRAAVAKAEDEAGALKLLNAAPQRNAETLYRSHRQEAREVDADDIETIDEALLGEVLDRLARLRERLADGEGGA